MPTYRRVRARFSPMPARSPYAPARLLRGQAAHGVRPVRHWLTLTGLTFLLHGCPAPPAAEIPEAPTPSMTPAHEENPDLSMAVFGMDAEGILFHIDEGWSANFNYLCVDGDCRPGRRTQTRFERNVADRVERGETVSIAFKVENNGAQCLTGDHLITRGAGLVFIDSPCAGRPGQLPSDPGPISTPGPPLIPSPVPPLIPPLVPSESSVPDPTPLPTPTSVNPGDPDTSESSESPESPEAPEAPSVPQTGLTSVPKAAGLTTIDGETITTKIAERFRQRHEGDLEHDRYIARYAQGSTYEIVLIDRPESLEVQLHSPDAALQMVNFTYDHIVSRGFVDPPQYTGGGFMAKGSLDGPANDDPQILANSLYFEMTSIRGRAWKDLREAEEIVTLEFTPRIDRGSNSPQYYSDILRYRAGRGGIVLERDDPRYFSGGTATNFAHGTPGFELSQPFLGIDQALLHRFTLGRELFRASFLGAPLPGNGGHATGSPPDAPAHACVDCHFQLAKSAPPDRSDPTRQGFIHQGAELRVAPSLVGLGLLEAVDQSTIEGFAAASGGKLPTGRFGWKAAEPTLRDQIRKAFALDLGMEQVDPVQIERIEDYIRGLGVPVRRHPEAQANQQSNTDLRAPESFTITDPDVLSGEAAFQEAGCHVCHLPEMQTGNSHPVPQFRNLTIRPFTDLLLWNMGAELCAVHGEGNADPCEWRTAPLWGIRLQEWVTGHATFLHDGRARSLEEAILLHGGDAARARAAYEQLSPDRRLHLLLYLLSL